MPLPKPRRLGNNYKCTVVESSMDLDFDKIIPDLNDRPGVKEELELFYVHGGPLHGSWLPKNGREVKKYADKQTKEKTTYYLCCFVLNVSEWPYAKVVKAWVDSKVDTRNENVVSDIATEIQRKERGENG